MTLDSWGYGGLLPRSLDPIFVTSKTGGDKLLTNRSKWEVKKKFLKLVYGKLWKENFENL